jgi:hypothetical protein
MTTTTSPPPEFPTLLLVVVVVVVVVVDVFPPPRRALDMGVPICKEMPHKTCVFPNRTKLDPAVSFFFKIPLVILVVRHIPKRRPSGRVDWEKKLVAKACFVCNVDEVVV